MTAVPACHEHGETRVRWRPRPDGLEESVQFCPGYNCQNRTSKGHGVHGMEIWWALRGPAGGADLAISTGWIPGTLEPGHGLSPDGTRSFRLADGGWSTDPRGWGSGVHARHPQYEGHEASAGPCEMTGGTCYHDTSLSGADGVVPQFLARGEQAVWDELERLYAGLTAKDGAS